MANAIENIIRAKDEATPTLKAVRSELSLLKNEMRAVPATVAPGLAPNLKLVQSEIRNVGAALTQLAPQATGAFAPMQSLFSLGSASLGPITLGVVGLAVSVGVLATAAKKAADEVAALGKQAEAISNLSESTGVAVANIQGLQVTLENAGISGEALTVSFRQLNKAIATQDPVLKQLGITTTDTFQAFLQLSDIFAKAPDGANKTAAAVALLGRSGETLIPVMNRGATAIQGMIDQAAAMGLAFSGQTVQALKDVDDKFDLLNNHVQGLKNNLVLLAVPGVSAVVTKLNELLQVLNDLPAAFDKFIEKMRTAPGFAKLEQLVLQAQDIDKMEGKLKELQGIYEQFQKTVGTTQGDAANSSKRATASQLEDLERITAKLKSLTDTFKEFGSLGGTQGPLTKSGAIGSSQNVPTEAESAGIPSPPKPATEPTEREKMLQRLKDLLGLTSAQAKLAYDDLKKLDDSAAAGDILDKLTKARNLRETGAQQPSTVPENPAGTKAQQDLIANQKEADAILLEDAETTAKAMADAFQKAFAATDFSGVVESWRATVEQMLEPAAILNESLNSLLNGLTAGFQNAFANIGRATGALKSVVVSIFKSLVSEVTALLARLAALKIFKFIISLPFSGGGEVIQRAQGGIVQRFAAGGMVRPEPLRLAVGGPGGAVRGPGTGTSDSIPAMLSHGEFVVRAAVVGQPGVLEHLKVLNAGVAPAPATPAIAFRPVINLAAPQTALGAPQVPRMTVGGPTLNLPAFVQEGASYAAPRFTVPHYPIPRFASGGYSPGGVIQGPGSETSDSILARLSRGEFVVKASVVKQPGVLQYLKALNSGSVAVSRIQVASVPGSGLSVDRELVKAISRFSPAAASPARGMFAATSGGSGGTGASIPSSPQRGGDTYVIQAINARDAIMSLTQPQGELRKAMDRVAITGAY